MFRTTRIVRRYADGANSILKKAGVPFVDVAREFAERDKDPYKAATALMIGIRLEGEKIPHGTQNEIILKGIVGRLDASHEGLELYSDEIHGLERDRKILERRLASFEGKSRGARA